MSLVRLQHAVEVARECGTYRQDAMSLSAIVLIVPFSHNALSTSTHSLVHYCRLRLLSFMSRISFVGVVNSTVFWHVLMTAFIT